MSTASDLLKSAAIELGLQAMQPFPGLQEDLITIIAANRTYQILDGRLLPGLDAATLAVSQHKQVAKSMMQAAGLPCAHGVAFEVLEEWIEDGKFELDDELRLLLEDGQRWVAKPARGSGGKGIGLNIHTADDLQRHLGSHALQSGDWILEHFATGNDIGLLVLDGAIISAVGRKAFALAANP